LQELQRFLEQFWKEGLQRLREAAEWEERRKRRGAK
jgi:hypothetical protein